MEMKIEISKNDVCCGIVLYNPEIERLKQNIKLLANQVKKIVLVDNKSNNLDEIKKQLHFWNNVDLIENPRNMGIARALNQIMTYAKNNGYIWFLTMDQDSICDKTLIQHYIEAMPTVPAAVYSPYVLNNNKISLKEYKLLCIPTYEKITDPINCITSGSLVNTKAAMNIGGYNENLFIDCVDVDFNIRLMINGYSLIRVNSTYMQQAMGDGYNVYFFDMLYLLTKNDIFKHLRITPVYSNKRLYYIARNSKYVRKRYGSLAGKRMSNKWMIGQFIYYSLTYPLSRNRIEMWRSINRGLHDASKLK